MSPGFKGKLRIGVTVGDPSGIGPELVGHLRAPPEDVEVVVFGSDAGVDAGAVTPGRPTRETGRAQIAFLEAAVAEAKAGRLDAIVTAPIHKASAIEAGFVFTGHTDYLAAAFGVPEVTMMLAGAHLRVTLVTTHVPLAQVPALLTADKIARTIVRTVESLRRDFGIDRPRVAVAGLNPHAGEAGHLGREDETIIAPAVAREMAHAEISGPHVPDVVFRQAARGQFDAVVAMYHDQGLIPLKLIDFDTAVNLTLGLPIVRTSPDHGVAHDIAGMGRADPSSFLCAFDLAVDMVRRRQLP